MQIVRTARPESWIEHVFSARAAQTGGVIRRAVPWVEAEIGRARFVREVTRRGFTLLESNGQFIVICHSGPVRRIV